MGSSLRLSWPRSVPGIFAATVLFAGPTPAPARVLQPVQTAEAARLDSARRITISPDGRHLYVEAEGLNVFARDPASGVLRFVEKKERGDHMATVSPDGRHVYAVEIGFKYSALRIFARDAASGKLADVATPELTFEEPWGLALSPDGRHLYSGSIRPAVHVLARDADTGTLREVAEAPIVNEFGGGTRCYVSPDGRNVYALGHQILNVLARDPKSGALENVEFHAEGMAGVEGLEGADDLAISPDGRHVYLVSAWPSHAVAVFEREPARGALSFVEAHFDGDDLRLEGATSVALSPDGLAVYVSANRDDTVSVFSRDPNTGALTLAQELVDDSDGVDGLAGAHFVTPSADGRHLFVAGLTDGAVALFMTDGGDGVSFRRAWFSDDFDFHGLVGAYSSVTSPDGSHVYVTGQRRGTVTALARDGASGSLAPIATYVQGTGGIDGLALAKAVTLSPDGEHLYVASSQIGTGLGGALAVFARDANSGTLDFVEAHEREGLLGASSVVVSPEGRHVYVGGSERVVALTRDAATGALDFVTEVSLVGGFYEALAITLSPDGRHLYAGSSMHHSVTVFARDDATGALSLVATYSTSEAGELEVARSVAVSPDGRHVYVTGYRYGTLVAFARDDATGELSRVETHFDDDAGLDGLAGADSVAVSPDGAHVFVAASRDDAASVFARDGATGKLSLLKVHRDETLGIGGLDLATRVAVSPDGRWVDVTSRIESAVTVFRRRVGPCVDAPRASCLGGNRFRVEVEWRDFQGESGVARAVPYGSDDSGLFWFFDADNWEMLVKVLDGCAINQRYWVFAAATTDVETTLQVTDELTGVTRRYTNPLGRPAPAITDTDAFAGCGIAETPSPPPHGSPAAVRRSIDATDRPGFRRAAEKATSDHLVVGLGGQCLDVQGGDPSDGTPVNLFRCHGEPNQRWRLERVRGGHEVRGLDGRCLSAGEEIDSTRARAVLGPCGEDLWELDHDYRVATRLLHLESGRCLDVEGAEIADRTPVQLFACHVGPNQTWRLERIDCRETATRLCLNRGRFQVEVQWRDFGGNTGPGRAVPFGSNDSGLFWFFSEANWELQVKVLDGCGLNDHFWVFAAATTDVGYTLRVTDTRTGDVREVVNPLGTASDAVTDTQAFATCP